MVDAIGAGQIKKRQHELELRKLMQQKAAPVDKVADVPKGVKEMTEAMAASQNDAVQYEAAPNDVDAEPTTGGAAPDRQQQNVAAVKEADEILKKDGLATQDKAGSVTEEADTQPAVGEVPQKPKDKAANAQGSESESIFKAPPQKSEPQAKAEEKIKDPAKAEADIAADPNELLKRRERNGSQ
jgi:hypothetical protein